MSNVFIQGGDSIEFDVNSTSADESIPGVGDVLQLIYVVNGGGPSRAQVKAGVGAQVATDTDYPLLGDTVQYLYVGFDADTIGCISTAGAGRLSVARGSIR